MNGAAGGPVVTGRRPWQPAPCGARAASLAVRSLARPLLVLLAACSTVGDRDDGAAGFGGSGGASADAAPTCGYGQIACDGTVARTCDGKGGYETSLDCASLHLTCADALGCVACVPFTGTCKDGVATLCDATGAHTTRFDCDPVQGVSCRPDGCKGPCSPSELSASHVGCEFWSIPTANDVWRSWFDFGVALASASPEPAHVTVSRGASQVASVTIAPGEAQVVPLPWIDALKGGDADASAGAVPLAESVLAPVGAYRVRSDRPIAAWQLNPVQWKSAAASTRGCPDPLRSGSCLAYSTEASLLLPSHVLGADHVVGAWHAWHVDKAGGAAASIGDFLAIAATAPGTVVEVRAASAILGGTPLGALGAGATGQVTLGTGDVLELVTRGASAADSFAGATVRAPNGEPLVVQSGAPCAEVPDGNPACDHLEETVLPSYALGDDYLAAAPVTPHGVRVHTLRLVAAEDDTTFDFDPPAVHKTVTVHRGEVVELASITDDVHVHAQRPFVAVQLLHGSGPAGSGPPEPPAAGSGDPAQTIVVPTRQFRTDLVFFAPPTWPEVYAAVVAPTGARVLVDGAPIAPSDLRAIGASGFSTARVRLAATGAHRLSADRPAGATVYGYADYTAFAYPAGLSLTPRGITRR